MTLALVAGSLVSAGCATNPATGKSQLMLISEAQEIAMGREAHPQILSSMGVYDDPEIQEYVSSLGQELAAKSERAHLEWTFTVVDDPLVNAFALPGGYIYITRGILAHFNSEAELAAVLGHEIGHVVARHSANQMSKQQLASIGLVVGTVLLDPEDRGLGYLAGNIGMQLAFLKFSRDDERQADSLGLRYIDSVGYDPRPMTNVFETLGRVSDAAGGARGPNFMATHPAPENRVARLGGEIAEMGVDFTGRPVRQAEYQQRLAGMPYGQNPREGFFEGNAFYHPDLAFKLVFPEGWKTQNTRTQVAAISPNEDAIIAMTLADAESLEGAENTFYQESKATRGRRFRTGIRGLDSLGSYFSLTSNNQQGQSSKILGQAAFVEKGDNIYRLLAYSPDGRYRNYERVLADAVGSFELLRDRKYLDVQPAKIDTVTLDRDMDIAEFHRRYPSSVDLQTIAIVNGVEEGETMERGRVVKRITGGELP